MAIELELLGFGITLDLFEHAQQLGPLLFFHDEADAALAAAAAWVLIPGIGVEGVVVGEFVTGLDVLQRIDPDVATDDVGLAVGLAGVVDVARRVVALGSVDVITLIEREDIDRCTAGFFGLLDQRITTARGFSFGDLFTDVLDDGRVVWNIMCSKDAAVMDGGAFDFPETFRGGFRHGSELGAHEVCLMREKSR